MQCLSRKRRKRNEPRRESSEQEMNTCQADDFSLESYDGFSEVVGGDMEEVDGIRFLLIPVGFRWARWERRDRSSDPRQKKPF